MTQEAKSWWRKITDEWELGNDALLVLRGALEAFDRCQQARKLLEKEGLVVLDRFKQQKVHPAAAIERDSRLQMVRVCPTVADDLFAHLMPALTDVIFAVELGSRT